jgi:outer membrane immunogenic protein
VQNSKLMLSTAMAFGAIMSIGAASAADMGALPYAKAWPTTRVDPIIGWAGFYAGINGGGLWAHSAITDVNRYAALATPGTVTSVNTRGFLAGGQLGYTWQASCFIFGIEADAGYMDLGGNKLLTGTASGTRVGLKSGAYGDVTGRVGVTFDRALFYAKGGYAVLEDASSFSTVTGSFSGVQKHSINSGYTIGAGVEYKIAPGWSAKVEYLHFDFGNYLNYTVIDGFGRRALFNQTLSVDTVKAGLNYSWGSPVIARY